MPTVDSVFDQVRDLAAVRVATYVQTDENKVTEAICRRFASPAGSAVVVDLKDKARQQPREFLQSGSPRSVLARAGYRWHLCQRRRRSVRSPGLQHDGARLERDRTRHRLQAHERPLAIEKSTLINIGHLTRSGDGMLSQLLAATDAHNAEQTSAFTDVYDFVARARRWFPGTDFATNAGPLFEELQTLRLNTPSGIQRQIGELSTVADRSKAAS